MDVDEWHDPLLITDASSSSQQQLSISSYNYYPFLSSRDLGNTLMEEDSDCSSPIKSQGCNAESFKDPIAGSVINGRDILGFSLTSPDLVICTGSPDIPARSYGNSPELLKGCSISLENGIKGSEEAQAVSNLSIDYQGLKDEDLCLPDHFELPSPPGVEENSSDHSVPIVSVNVGSTDCISSESGIQFSEDKYFCGGNVLSTETRIEESVSPSVYQTARVGNSSYHFNYIGAGFYLIDLHFAEVVLTDGSHGLRVFDVFIQEHKVISSLDIFARVGANTPLLISDLEARVDGEEGIFIRFEGVIGMPIVCGISIRKHSSRCTGELELLEFSENLLQRNSLEVNGDIEADGELQLTNVSQEKELKEVTRQVEELKRENELKCKECAEARKALNELQNELMRKSMHVGSLAFAIEGQVKEKSRWFSSLRDLTRNLKILKMDQIKVSEEALSYKRQFLADFADMSSTIQNKLKQQVELHEDLKIKFIKGAKEQKELYNKVLDLKGNIRVFCRCRPLNAEETAAGASMAIDFEAAKDGELTVKSNGMFKKAFKFDAVFSPQADQAEVFEDAAPLATSVLDGYSVCIFAYGQTGTGKTFTMEGTEESRGVNYRTLEELFRIIEERKNAVHFEISVSVLEVYNEQIRDLLVSGSQQCMKRLEIKQDGEGMHHVPGLVEAHVNNMNEVWEALRTGSNARAIGSTNANEHSSRSHCIHCVMVKGENLLNGECTRSKLWLVDLAGSERIAKTEVQGERLKETQNINRSLSALGDVISSLATKSAHIPFRNSKLTHLLQDSLGGDSKTLMFVQISPNTNDLSETLCSLNFASRVRGIELGPAKKQVDSMELLKYKQMVEKGKQDMKNKDFQMKKMEDTVHGLDIKLKEKDMKNKSLQDKIKELESQLLVERKLARQHIDSKIAEQFQQQHMRQQNEEEDAAPMRPPLASKLFAPKIYDENKYPLNITRPLTENNSHKLPVASATVDCPVKHNDLTEKENKENNPDIDEQPIVPKRMGRASMCTIAQRILPTPAPRRNSLIPMRTVSAVPKLPPPLFPLRPIQSEEVEEDGDDAGSKCLPEPTAQDSPKELKTASKKLSCVLRRSLQKKMQFKSPMQQNVRRVGVNVAMEKVRISIGSRGRMAQRVLGSARRVPKENQQKQRWNIGTANKAVL
ncbi:Kinesin-4 [Capsicum annuum]|uniref:kinesin-like protein KIN-14Q isoform X2 n=1 Tax=Capsicum annuum TaxID=4072 RepID=UPI0007BFAF50|nr:kinesin-like protein KIN-14Q isoform X2 [Capsicum annuum]KAF3649997.1 Kinesin-4 [Capsicum annuum]KAF3652322.1 Kinesin-4 [Capsicum annuum]